MGGDAGVHAMPERVARYELLIPVGTGGMGSVYLGHSEVMPGVVREVAVKLMHPQLRAEPGVADQLLQEAKLAASIRHPNVVQVLEAGDSPHGVFIVLDFVDGDTLSGLLRATLKRGEQVPFPIAARILHDALTGLHAAHELRGDDGRPLELVHRDFSPQNILVGVDGIARLTDFGIAKALGNINATATGIVKGKVGYMSPEQARGQDLDRRSDVWAAGVVAWELLAGKRLFRGANEAATLLQVVSGKPPPRLSSVRRDASPALDQALVAALEAQLNQRIGTAQAFRDRLMEALAPLGGMADQDVVGNFVREAVGDRIAKRRVQAADVKRLRHEIADLSASANQAAQDSVISSMSAATAIDTPSVGTAAHRDASALSGPGGPMEPVAIKGADGFPEDSTRAALSAERASVRAKPDRRWGVAVGALVALGVGGVVAWQLRGTGPGEPTTAAATGEPTATAEPVDREPPPETTTASPIAAPRDLVVSADSPIAQLRIGDRNIILPEPVKKAEVPLREGDTRRLVAIAKDGRKVELELAEGQRDVTIAFPDRPAGAASPRPVLPPKPKSGEDGPGLADSPY